MVGGSSKVLYYKAISEMDSLRMLGCIMVSDSIMMILIRVCLVFFHLWLRLYTYLKKLITMLNQRSFIKVLKLNILFAFIAPYWLSLNLFFSLPASLSFS